MHTIAASILIDLKEKESERELRPDSVWVRVTEGQSQILCKVHFRCE